MYSLLSLGARMMNTVYVDLTADGAPRQGRSLGRALRRRLRDDPAHWIALGRTHGVVEALLAGVLLVLAVVVEPAVVPHWGTTAMSIALCVAAGLSGRWPVPAGVAVGALLSVLAVMPSAWSGLAVHACLIPLFSASSRGLSRARWMLAGWYFVALVGQIAAATGLSADLLRYGAGWAAVISMALVMGTAFRYLAVLKDAERQAVLRQQRHIVARDIHDTVAHDLSLTVMRIEQAHLRGEVQLSDLDFALLSCRKAVRDLRRMMEVLREDDLVPRSFLRQSAVGALQSAVSQLQRAGFRPEVTVEGDTSQLKASVDDALGWILVEAASNVARHGDPNQACTILIDVQQEQVEVLVTNHAAHRSARNGRSGMGIPGMQERIDMLGGTLFVGSGEDGLWVTQAAIPT